VIQSINPASGALLFETEEHTPADIERALAGAASAQALWRDVPVEKRCASVRAAAGVLRKHKAAFARLITNEMGKPLAEAEAEIEKCAWNCEFYADRAPAFLAEENIASNASESVVVYEPLGVVLAIMPWNYPFWQLFRFAAPALAAGNGAVLKHANNVPQCALAIERVFQEAGFPDGLFRTLMIEPAAVAGIIADPRIAAVTLTGSTEVGSIVASQAGAQIKKQVLELGGSDPFIVLEDADVDAAAAVAVKARFLNVGQSCISAKRIIVHEEVAERFVTAFCAHAENLKIGDPLMADTNIGPMARANLRNNLHAQVERSRAAGAELRLGGYKLDGPGFFYAPTILDHVTPGMAAFDEETFGPAAAVIRVRDADEAIRLANATEFGLGAALWTSDLTRARKLAARIEAGAVFINGMVASDPRLPFGGVKKSGYGRELGVYGIREFTNIKSVWIGPARETVNDLSE
jgi:succinate-semialdehyde dehydrogenase/glutarate-semialdehyde dehydrogenase